MSASMRLEGVSHRVTIGTAILSAGQSNPQAGSPSEQHSGSDLHSATGCLGSEMQGRCRCHWQWQSLPGWHREARQ